MRQEFVEVFNVSFLSEHTPLLSSGTRNVSVDRNVVNNLPTYVHTYILMHA